MQAQTLLGWEQFAKGFPAQQWRRVQEDFDTGQHHARRRTRWMAWLVKCGWKHMRDLWDHRNGVFPAVDGAAVGLMEERLDKVIFEEKLAGSASLPDTLRAVWSISLTELRQASVPYRQHWLRVIRTGHRQGS